tara:strand:+ start:1263 stop:2078 length:816 start_codon:yes stop_codon:yes gene_type:complete
MSLSNSNKNIEIASKFEYANLYGFWTLYKREVLRFLSMPMQTLIAPATNSLLFLFVFSIALGRGTAEVSGVMFVQFMAPGLIMMAIINSSFQNATSTLMISKMQGNIVDILMPPLTAGELLLGLTLGGATRGMFVGAIVGIVLYCFVPFTLHSVIYIISFSFFASCLLSTIGVIVGVWAYKFDDIATITNFIIMPLSFLSGTFYSVEKLPQLFQSITYFNPFFYMIDGFRTGFIGYSDSSLLIGILLLVSLNIILFILGYLLFRSGYKLKT